MSSDEFFSDLYDLVPAVLRASAASAIMAAIGFACFFEVRTWSGPIQPTHFDAFAAFMSWLIWCPIIATFTLCVTLPVTAAVGGISHFALRNTKLYSPLIFGVCGFLVGVLLWSIVSRGAPPLLGNLMSAWVVGGPAGFVAGRTLARRMLK